MVFHDVEIKTTLLSLKQLILVIGSVIEIVIELTYPVENFNTLKDLYISSEFNFIVGKSG